MRILAFLEAAFVTGPAKNLLEFCRTVRGSEVEVSIATFARGTAESDFTSAVREAGIPLITIPETSALDPGVIGRLRSAVAAARPDIVQTHAVKSHFLLYASRLWKTRPWIAFHHGYTMTDAKMRLYNELDRISLRKPARLVTVSRAFERQLTARGVAASRITVLHNAVDPQWAARVRSLDVQECRRLAGVAESANVILAVGRLSQEKGHIDLLEAFRRVREGRPGAVLMIVGDGPERTRLEQAAGPGVIFAGQVRDTASYYAAADVLALPSHTEGSPNVLLEAMAVNLPAAATAVGGIPEIVRDRESALLVAPRSPELLAAALEEILSGGALRQSLAAHARSAIETRHSPGARAKALLEVYRGVLEDVR